MAKNPAQTSNGNTSKDGESSQKKGDNPSSDISLEDAHKKLSAAASRVQQLWLNNAVNLANAIESNRPVSAGLIDDLKKNREQFEELERPRQLLRNLLSQGKEEDKET